MRWRLNTEQGRRQLTSVPAEVTTIAKGASIFLVGTVLSVVLRYAFEVLIARRLGPSLFGVFFLGLAVFRVLERVATLELGSGLLRFVSLYRGERKFDKVKGTILAGLKISLLGGAATAFLLFIFSSLISRGVFHEIQLAPVLRFFSLGLILTAATEIFVYSHQALGAIQYRVLTRMVFEPGLSIILALLFFKLGMGLKGASLSFLLPLAGGVLVSFLFLRHLFPQLVQGEWTSVVHPHALLRFSIPLLFAGMLSLFLRQITPLILGYFRPTWEVGLYAGALRTSLLLVVILDSFNALFAPMIADLTNRKEMNKLSVLFNIVTKWTFALSLPLFLTFVFFGRELLGLWGKGYEGALTCLLVLSAGQLINCSTGPVGYLISMSGRTMVSLANSSGVLALNLVLNFILIPRHGLLGAAIAVSCGLMVVNAVRLIQVRVILKIQPYSLDFLKPIAAAALSSFLLIMAGKWVLPDGGPLLQPGLGMIGLVIFYASFLALMGIRPEEKLILQRIKQKLLGHKEKN